MTKQTIKNALEKIGVTDGQKQVEFFAAFAEKKLGQISDSDVTAALNKLGVTDEKTLGDFFAAVREPEIMEQELDIDELDAVAGGDACDDDDPDPENCTQQRRRHLNSCASEVRYDSLCGYNELESMCSLNDGCYYHAVIYYY